MTYAELRERRMRHHISQAMLARASGFSRAAISSWEREKNHPSQEDLARLDIVLSRMIQDIDRRILQPGKKRLTPSQQKRGGLPPVIRSAAEYQMRLSQRAPLPASPYREELTRLYQRARAPRDPGVPKAAALFSGCGGLSLGFASEGFQLVGHVELLPSMCQIYQQNFPDSRLFGQDICGISDTEILQWAETCGAIDILIGGPPCQGFSLAGKRDPMDHRNQLYQYYVHIAELLRPKVFVMENVRLLTSMRNTDGRLFIDCITEDFARAGYSITRQEINTWDYGVPQSRARVILIGSREGLPFDLPLPREARRLTFRDATFDLQKLESGETSTDPLHWSITHPEHVIQWLRDVPEGHSAHENTDPALRPPSGFNTTYKRILWDQPCSTISTNFSMISGCRNVHPTSTRSLTIREAARAQSFPDEFIFTGKWGDIRTAIGNAVPPIFAAALAKAVRAQFFNPPYAGNIPPSG